jgi:DNA repair protein RadA/Sms
MAAIKKVFVCSSCGATSPKWMGKCSYCNEWNTYLEEIISKETTGEKRKSTWSESGNKNLTPILLSEVSSTNKVRIVTEDNEFNRVLGGGIVPGSIILVGGQPGIGKSTLMLQIASKLPHKVLYISGEESEEQIKLRANRVGFDNDQCYIFTETNTEKIFAAANKLEPELIIIDSIQTISSPFIDASQGTISQVRETASEIQRFAKETNIPVIVIGHITKEGTLAGPKILEHIVDTVLQFEGEKHYTYRILYTLKNRFGSTDEMGIYEMLSTGMREVSNPSELLLSQKDDDLSGTAIATTMEGQRPMLIETQALVSRSVYGTPQRTATGFDGKRMSMLLAVLEKKCGYPFGMHDVFLNIAGGIRVEDPGIDLAIICALISSLQDMVIPAKYCFAGEVGLSGEIRSVNKIEQRIQEADRLGFSDMFISKYNTKGIDPKRYNIQLHYVANVEQLREMLFL